MGLPSGYGKGADHGATDDGARRRAGPARRDDRQIALRPDPGSGRELLPDGHRSPHRRGDPGGIPAGPPEPRARPAGRGRCPPGHRLRALVSAVNRGEVWWVEDPAAGRRPFTILTRQSAIPVLRNVVAVPATRTVRALPSEVVLGEDDGMPAWCALSFDNVTLVPKAYFVERICELGPAQLAQVCDAMQIGRAHV